MFEGEEVALVTKGKISGSAGSLGITVVLHEGKKGRGVCVCGGDSCNKVSFLKVSN